MTKTEAKKLSLEVWRYLAEHPEIRNKRDFPHEILNKIRYMKCSCPLYEVLRHCALCPLGGCIKTPSYFGRWYFAEDNEVREEAAREIVRLIAAWEIDE